MIKPYAFQTDAAAQIASRLAAYIAEPLTVRRDTILPSYQNLSALTGSGKTIILADTIQEMRARLPAEPIVLWLSKGRVIVWQTLANLTTGKYRPLVSAFDVKPLLDCRPDDVARSDRALALVATVGKFNQREKSDGDRKVHKVALDQAGTSLWELLRERRTHEGVRRPLIVVYDEGHNLSDQQTRLLLELSPDALIAASATLRIPEALSPLIDRLQRELQWTNDHLVTTVPSSAVVLSGLVKKEVEIGGYVTTMEEALDQMLEDFHKAERAAAALSLPFRPKAIYVSSTNTVDNVPPKEDVGRLFRERMARPIRIWRYLVEQKGVDPREIAVYCNLKFDPKRPPPPQFTLFSGGDADYDRFVAGNYRHIIFNLALQEGWDDPACGFAYIDKEMQSADQITQVVGRLLRQPGAQHYAVSVLNNAHFYIRADEKGVFEAVLDGIEQQLAADYPDITLTVRKGQSSSTEVLTPRKTRTVPRATINSAAAKEPIGALVDGMMDYSADVTNTVGRGSRIKVLQAIGAGSARRQEWVETEHSNRVTARWVFTRELERRYPRAYGLCDIEHPKFDARIEYYSRAADHVREVARKVAEAYVGHSVVISDTLDAPYTVGDVAVDRTHFVKYKHSLHEGYSDLNTLEREFAQVIDGTQRVWCRNPSAGAYEIQLLDHGNTRTFNPDFLVWADKHIIAIDTKGDHLIHEDAGRKLFHIEKIGDGPDLVIRLVTEGKWEINKGEPKRLSGHAGYTVWSLKQGKLHAEYCDTGAAASRACLRA